MGLLKKVPNFGDIKIFLFFLKEINIVQQEGIKLIKSESKDIYNITKHFYFKKGVLLNFLLIKGCWKRHQGFHKKILI